MAAPTVDANHKHISGTAGRVRADMVNFFAATAIISTFCLPTNLQGVYFVCITLLAIVSGVGLSVIPSVVMTEGNRKVRKWEFIIGLLMVAVMALAGLVCGALAFGASAGDKPLHWLVFNLIVAAIVASQFYFFYRKEEDRDANQIGTLIFLALLFLLTVASAILGYEGIKIAGGYVGIVAVVSWGVLEFISMVATLRDDDELKRYALKNVLQIVAVVLFIVFFGLALGKGDASIVLANGGAVAALFYSGLAVTLVGVGFGAWFGGSRYLKKSRG